MYNSIDKRLRGLLSAVNLSQNNFADKIGVTRQGFEANIRKNNPTQPGMKVITGIKKNYPQTDLNWLIWGENEMFLKNEDELLRKEKSWLEEKVKMLEEQILMLKIQLLQMRKANLDTNNAEFVKVNGELDDLIKKFYGMIT